MVSGILLAERLDRAGEVENAVCWDMECQGGVISLVGVRPAGLEDTQEGHLGICQEDRRDGGRSSDIPVKRRVGVGNNVICVSLLFAYMDIDGYLISAEGSGRLRA